MDNITYKILSGPDKQSLQEALFVIGQHIDSYWNEVKWDGQKELRLNLDWICKMWLQKSLYVNAVFDRNKPIGFIVVSVTQGMLNGQLEAHSLAAYLEPSYRNQHIAERMGLMMRKYLIDKTDVDVVFWDKLISSRPFKSITTIIFNRNGSR